MKASTSFIVAALALRAAAFLREAAQTSPRTSPRTRRNRCLLREIPRELVRVAAAALHPLDASVLAVASKWLKAAAWDGLKSQERFVWSEAVERGPSTICIDAARRRKS